jgi:hypothetical protein
MPHPTRLAAWFRPVTDFATAIFARGCVMQRRTPAARDAIERRRVLAVKSEMKTSAKKQPITVCLEFHDDQARTVCVVGSFNKWNPETTPMLKTGAGQWIKELGLSPGIYEYQYVVDGKWINDPHAVKSTPNPFGGRNSVLVVEQRSGTSGPGATRVSPNAKLPEKRSRS